MVVVNTDCPDTLSKFTCPAVTPCSISPQLHRQIVIEQLGPLIFSLVTAHLCMTAGHCKWPYWAPNCRTLWPQYLPEDVANLALLLPCRLNSLIEMQLTLYVFICN